MPTPPLRWAGAKRWLIPQLLPELEAVRFRRYVDPFLGAGAIPLALPPTTPMLLGDYSPPLINLWQMIRKYPVVVAQEVQRLFETNQNCREGYNRARLEFNLHPKFGVRAAGLMLYLNSICFNGLYRENQRGQMNTPFGDVKKPRLASEVELTEIATHLARAVIRHADFERLIDETADGDGCYCDPPYDAGYAAYVKSGFSEADQRRLATALARAVRRGVRVWATNSDTPLIREIYAWAEISPLEEPRAIAANGAKRRPAACLMIRR